MEKKRKSVSSASESGGERKVLMIKLKLGSFRLNFSITAITKTYGVYSLLENGKHILMWDFDDLPLRKVIVALRAVQNKYFLPEIRIMQTKEKSYHAYCFLQTDFRRCVEILAATPNLDWGFFLFGCLRQKFTLRVGEKAGRNKPKLIGILGSEFEGDCTPKDLNRWVKYDTIDRTRHNPKVLTFGD